MTSFIEVRNSGRPVIRQPSANGASDTSLEQRPISADKSRNPIDQGLKMTNIEQGISNPEGFLSLLRFDIPCSVFDIPHLNRDKLVKLAHMGRCPRLA